MRSTPRQPLPAERGGKRTGAIGSIVPGDHEEVARDIQRIWWELRHRRTKPAAAAAPAPSQGGPDSLIQQQLLLSVDGNPNVSGSWFIDATMWKQGAMPLGGPEDYCFWDVWLGPKDSRYSIVGLINVGPDFGQMNWYVQQLKVDPTDINANGQLDPAGKPYGPNVHMTALQTEMYAAVAGNNAYFYGPSFYLAGAPGTDLSGFDASNQLDGGEGWYRISMLLSKNALSTGFTAQLQSLVLYRKAFDWA